MSTVAFIKGMVAAGFSYDDALKAAEIMEATSSPVHVEAGHGRSPRQERNRRYYESRKAQAKPETEDGARLNASEKRLNASEPSYSDAPTPSLPSSPQTPQQPTHPRGNIYPAREKQPKAQPRRFVPGDWRPNPSHIAKAEGLGIDLAQQVELFRNHEYAKPKTDFDRAFHTWLQNAAGRFSSPGSLIRSPSQQDIFPYDPRPANDRYPRPSHGGQSRTDRDQSAALRVLARRGALGGSGEGEGANDDGPARPNVA